MVWKSIEWYGKVQYGMGKYSTVQQSYRESLRCGKGQYGIESSSVRNVL